MLEPKRRRSRRYWEALSDDQLLSTELTTDDPEGLDNLVYELPPGDEEPYVEFKYNLRGSGRESFRCVHGNHPHLAGFVMRKGLYRFLVGHICGKHIYGEDFEEYTSDFDAAVNRRDAVRRKREIDQATGPFLAYLSEVSKSKVFSQYESLRDRLAEHVPWIWENVPLAAHLDSRVRLVDLPQSLFDSAFDPLVEFNKVVAEINATVLLFVSNADQVKYVGLFKRRMEAVLTRLERIFAQLKEAEDFFQSAVLSVVCKLANEHDNPKKRKYVPDLLSITCKRDKSEVSVRLPKSFKVPERIPLEAFKAALSGMSDSLNGT